MAEDETVGWHYRLKGHELEHILGDSEGPEGQGGSSLWHHKESDVTEQLNNNNLLMGKYLCHQFGIVAQVHLLRTFCTCFYMDACFPLDEY